MNFTSLEYWVFLPLTVAAYYMTPHRLRNAVLLLSSYLFYTLALWYADLPWSFVFVLIGVTLITYAFGLLLPSLSGRVKRVVQILSVLCALGALFHFKYLHLLSTLFSNLLSLSSAVPMSAAALLAPIGVSVFSFQAVGYLIDIGNKKIAPERNILRYALFLCFFPQITSGPIARPTQLLSQFREKHSFCYQSLLFGGQRFLWGLFKKTVAADWLMLIIRDSYSDPSPAAGTPLLTAVLLYGAVLYFDFSGYSDMAIGSARMMGFSLLENFSVPYFSTNFSGFWKRWHISLTSWLTDYIFTPLVWSRWANKLAFGKKWSDHAPHMLANLFLVFLISGLWHGASVNFVIWGLLQGLFRACEEGMHRIRKPRPLQSSLLECLRVFSKRVVVYLLFCFSLVFFLQNTLGEALSLLSRLFDSFSLNALMQQIHSVALLNASNSLGYAIYSQIVVAVSLILIALLDWKMVFKAPKGRVEPHNVLRHLSALPRWLCYVFMLIAILTVGVFGKSGFIYGGIM